MVWLYQQLRQTYILSELRNACGPHQFQYLDNWEQYFVIIQDGWMVG